MSFATDMQQVALDLLSELGQPLTLTRYSTDAYDPATGNVDPVTSTIYTGHGQPSAYKLSQIDGTTIQQGDILLSLYTTSIPEIGDEVTIDSDAYRVMDVTKCKAQGLNVYYRLQLRK